MNYIQQQKIRHAQNEIILGKSVNEISQELGYSSAYHLSKAFKNIVGMRVQLKHPHHIPDEIIEFQVYNHIHEQHQLNA